MGYAYLLHFDQPIGNADNPRGQAQHYLGYTSRSVKKRLQEHASGNGARLMEVIAERGISWQLVRTWKGTWATEKQLKRKHNNCLLCPICAALRGRKATKET